MNQILAELLGIGVGLSLIVAYFAGRIQQQSVDHRLERERWTDYFAKRARS